MTTYSFVNSDAARPSATNGVKFELIIRQQPDRARVCTAKERERRPVDPPPIIQLKIHANDAMAQNYLQNPYFFMCANLMEAHEDRVSSTPASDALSGTIVSSLYRLKDIDNSDGGFFIFGDVSIKVEGSFRMKFNLFEVVNRPNGPSLEVVLIQSVISQPFVVYSAKSFPGMSQSTFLSRSFSDQGVRIRIRKEHRIQMKTFRPSELESQTSAREEHNQETEVLSYNKGKNSLPMEHPGGYRQSNYSHQHQTTGGSAYVSRIEHRNTAGFHPYAQYGSVNHQYTSSSQSLPSMYAPQNQWSPRTTQAPFDSVSVDAGTPGRRLSGGTSTDYRYGQSTPLATPGSQYAPSPYLSRRTSSGARDLPSDYPGSRKNSGGSSISTGGNRTPMHPPEISSYFPNSSYTCGPNQHGGSSQIQYYPSTPRDDVERSFDNYQIHQQSQLAHTRQSPEHRASPTEHISNSDLSSSGPLSRMFQPTPRAEMDQQAQLRSIPPPRSLLQPQLNNYQESTSGAHIANLGLKLPPLQFSSPREDDRLGIYSTTSLSNAFNPYANSARPHAFAQY